MARYILANGTPSELIACVEIGTIGYYTELEVYDWGGLVTKNLRRRPPRPNHRWIVVDPVFLNLAPGLEPVRTVRRGEFAVFVFDLWQRKPPDTDKLQ